MAGRVRHDAMIKHLDAVKRRIERRQKYIAGRANNLGVGAAAALNHQDAQAIARLRVIRAGLKATIAHNNWILIRDPNAAVVLLPHQVDAWNPAQPYQPTAPGPGPQSCPYLPPVRQGDLVPPVRIPDDEAVKVFLESDVRGFPNWTGRRHLGQGGSGTVGLWEWNGQGRNQRPYTQIAVKELPADSNQNLAEEGAIMGELNRSSSLHYVMRLGEPITERIPMAFAGRVRRLIMEYCPGGSLEDLNDRRITLGVPFRESSLWRMFDCLVDGISVLEYGEEGRVQPLLGLIPQTQTLPGWQPMVHMDLKSGNILLGKKDISHAGTPILKLADFGLTCHISTLTPAVKRDIRESGTPGWYLPEQFTDRWDYNGWENSGIAGNFSFKSNVWAIGAVMWQLAMLDEAPQPVTEFVPNFTLDHAPVRNARAATAGGKTYGPSLQNLPYSDTLKHTIFQCLYEMPAHRPSLGALKLTIYNSFQTAMDADKLVYGDEAEPWLTFEPPEPVQPVLGRGGRAQAQRDADAFVAANAAINAAIQQGLPIAQRAPPPAPPVAGRRRRGARQAQAPAAPAPVARGGARVRGVRRRP